MEDSLGGGPQGSRSSGSPDLRLKFGGSCCRGSKDLEKLFDVMHDEVRGSEFEVLFNCDI